MSSKSQKSRNVSKKLRIKQKKLQIEIESIISTSRKRKNLKVSDVDTDFNYDLGQADFLVENQDEIVYSDDSDISDEKEYSFVPYEDEEEEHEYVNSTGNKSVDDRNINREEIIDEGRRFYGLSTETLNFKRYPEFLQLEIPWNFESLLSPDSQRLKKFQQKLTSKLTLGMLALLLLAVKIRNCCSDSTLSSFLAIVFTTYFHNYLFFYGDL